MDKSEDDNRNEDTGTKGRPDNKPGSSKVSKRETAKQKEIQLDLWQEEFLKTEGDKILCTGRQVGKSVICGRDAAEWSVKNKDTTILMIAPTERQAYALFDKTLTYLVYHFPTWIKKGRDKPTKEKITLTNNTKIYCLPVGLSGLGIRFLTVGRLYVDEASRIPEDVWSAVTPMLLTTGGDSIYLSTPFGAQGEFWRCWINQDSSYDSFTRFSMDSETVVTNRPICETWTERQKEKALQKLEQAKSRMSKREYAQEYLGQFLDDLNRLFSDDLIKSRCTGKRPTVRNPSGRFYLGVDIARMGEDKSAFEVLEKVSNETINQIENIVTTKTLTTDTFDKILHLEKTFTFKQIGIDAGSGSLGVGILDFLLKESLTKKKVIALNNLQRIMDHLGEKRKTLLKEDMYMNLLAMMEKGVINLLDDDDIIESLRSVQYEYVMVHNQFTKMRIFSANHSDSDIAEGLIRAAWLANTKSLNPFIYWF